jgi:hypothetical protein
MKALQLAWIVVAASGLSSVGCTRTEPAVDLPPGVAAADWIPLSATAGIALMAMNADPGGPLRFPASGEAEETVPQLLLQGTGILMVKLRAGWTRIDLAEPPARVRPLH